MSCYRIVLKNTGFVIDTFAEAPRAKAAAAWHARRLDHPTYPPEIIVQRVGPDGRPRKVWPQGVGA